jgi:hypothetical protein
MGVLESILAFIFAMTILMIPILAILRRPSKGRAVEDEELARRVASLELKLLERDNEVAGLKRDLSFLQRLIEDKREPRT